MTLSLKERAVLIGMQRDLDALLSLDPRGDHLPHGPKRGAYRVKVENACEGLVPMNLAGWIGHQPTPSEWVMYHRVYAALEKRGLVARHRLRGTNPRASRNRSQNIRI